ncbi:MAG: hypothetical protein DWQ46_05195 [Planctomycetota bacterium]|nr:MAG: hypothetical protein DWQ46_05195 [Planctomycetota bacterium]
MMCRNDKRLLRMAAAIRERAMSGIQKTAAVYLPVAIWQQLVDLHHQLERARERDWQMAEMQLQRDFSAVMQSLRADLEASERALQRSRPDKPFASVDELYQDLKALHEEFDELSFDRQDRTLSVTTEPIELEGVYLGTFQIQLDWSDLGCSERQSYRAIAVEGNPSAANESVTHPHVQDGFVCEGEGRPTIRAALQQGRLLDFFLIVANLLRTYNADSPYVSLDDWHGVECRDCGTTVSGDDRWTCENCESAVCGDCYYSCPDCDRTFCAGCVTQCEDCDEHTCYSCTKCCLGCERDLCPNCLEEDERCTTCHEQEESEYEDDEDNREPVEAIDAHSPV